MELMEIKKTAKENLKDIFSKTTEDWVAIYEYLLEHKTLEIFNGSVSLINVSFKDVEFEAISIENEQNVDFLVMINFLSPDGETVILDFYSFDHFYDSEGNDQSLLKKVLEENTLDEYDKMYKITHTKEGNLTGRVEDVYQYSQLNYFYIVFESILSEMHREEKSANFYLVEKTISAKIDEAFKEKTENIVSLYQKIKEEETKNPSLYVKILDGKEKKDALVFDKNEESFVLVFHQLENDEDYLTRHITLHYCSEKNEKYSNLETLFSDFEHFSNRPIYKLHETENKLSGKKFDFSGDTNSIYYVKKFEEFFTLLEN